MMPVQHNSNILTTDPHKLLHRSKIENCIKHCVSHTPNTFAPAHSEQAERLVQFEN